MGDIKRKRKLFSRPKKLFDRKRMDEENVLVKRYGLKNKREIWKAKTAVSKLRRRAKALIGKVPEEQQVFFDKLTKMGIVVRDVSDVLALTEENLFERRLQTVLFKKKLANTVKGARQLIVHKNVLVDGKVVNVPSFIVTKELEDKITLKEKKVRAKPEPEVPTEEIPAEAEVTEVAEGEEKTDETKEVSTEEVNEEAKKE
jgi:small subunit ribosomal protein S4